MLCMPWLGNMSGLHSSRHDSIPDPKFSVAICGQITSSLRALDGAQAIHACAQMYGPADLLRQQQLLATPSNKYKAARCHAANMTVPLNHAVFQKKHAAHVSKVDPMLPWYGPLFLERVNTSWPHSTPFYKQGPFLQILQTNTRAPTRGPQENS